MGPQDLLTTNKKIKSLMFTKSFVPNIRHVKESIQLKLTFLLFSNQIHRAIFEVT